MNDISHKIIAGVGFEIVKGDFIKEEILKTCMYPDSYANRRVEESLKGYLWPLPPKTGWYKKLMKKIEKNPVKILSYHPVEYIYIIDYYFKKVVNFLKKKDFKKASEFSGIFSHFIGDFLQPIHTLNPSFIDYLVEIPEKYLPVELHYKIESMTGNPEINRSYKPRILGENIKKATLKLYSEIYNATDEIRKDVLKMVSLLYKNNKKIEKYAEKSVIKATYLFADFLYTSMNLAEKNRINASKLSLVDYPYINCEIDMLYRYRPMKNISLIPYSGKSHPLKLKINGKIKRVNGIGVFPYVGPIIEGEDRKRDARVEYFILPGAFKKIRAICGVNSSFNNSSGKVVFRIFSDDNLIYQTEPVGIENDAIFIEVDLPKNTRFLTLSMLTVEEPEPPVWINHPHGVWANPELI